MVAVQVIVVVQIFLELHAVQVLSLSLCDALRYFYFLDASSSYDFALCYVSQKLCTPLL